MHKIFLALILLSVPVSTSAVAHSGTEQDEKGLHAGRAALLPQADGSGRFYHSGLPQGKPSKALCRLSLLQALQAGVWSKSIQLEARL
jgi:hypothetical protein